MEEQNTQIQKDSKVLPESEATEKKVVQANSEGVKEFLNEQKEGRTITTREQDDIVPLVKNKEKTAVATLEKPFPPTTPKVEKQSSVAQSSVLKEKKSIPVTEPKKEPQKQEKTESPKQQKVKTKEKKGKKGLLFFILFLIIIAGILSFIFGFITSQSDKIISGISVNGIDVSNLTKSEAVKKLENNYSKNITDDIVLKYGEYSKNINPEDIDALINIEDSVNAAYQIGRSENNIFANNFKVIITFFNKENVPAITSYDEAKLNTVIDAINDEIPGKVIKTSYRIEGENLIVEAGSSGLKVKSDELKSLILNSIVSNEKTVEIPVEHVEAEKPDIEAIYKEVHKDPVDASFKKDPYEIIKEEDGIDFAISMEEARQIASTDEKTFTIPLKITQPAITVKDLPEEAFPDLLGTYTTNFSSSSANRANNVRLAAQAINGVVLLPGESFSYNATVGQRTAARGYKEAGVYANGQVTTGIGGGICQVSSTLYNATLLADLEIVARSNHMFNPGYVPAGQDATVSWGGPDFQFKNTRSLPIRISTSSDGGILTVSIHGSKAGDEYDEIKVQSYVTGSIPFSTEYQDNASMEAGETRVIQGGSNGCRSATYKIYYKDGVEISKELVSNDTYNPHNQIVARGTATPVPAPDSTPAPTSDQSQDNVVSTDTADISF